MGLSITFLLVAEGTTETGLIPPLEKLCILCGADEVRGGVVSNTNFFKRDKPARLSPLAQKIKFALTLRPNVDILFVHRDADAQDPTPRYDEIWQAIQQIQPLSIPYVAVVPIQETEAWLLLDEMEIRLIAGKGGGRTPLHLPAPRSVEATAKPKERLQEALARASQLSGQRLKKFRADFPEQRRMLLENLNVEGDISLLSAWQRLNHDLQAVLDTLKQTEEPG